jgi:arylsulfatase A-like enzyme
MITKATPSAFLVLVLALAIASCGTDSGIPDPSPTSKDQATQSEVEEKLAADQAIPAEPEPPTPPKAEKMILVVIDALRADRLGCYGFSEATSPTIDAIAKEGILFETLHAASPWTAPSFGSLFTGVSPTVHGAGQMLVKGTKGGTRLMGVTVGGIRKALPTLPEMLPKRVATGAFVTNAFLSETLGFARGFDDYDHRNASIYRYRTADEITQKAIAWLQAHKNDPFFLLVHYFDPHMKYDPPAQYVRQFAPDKPPRLSAPFVDHNAARDGSLNPNEREKRFIRGLYNGELRFVDDQLSLLTTAMKEMGLLDTTWLVITSDHGEEHFEHGSFEHGHAYEEEITRVPLILRAPRGGWRAGSRISTSIRHVDIPPTVLALYGLDSHPHFEGHSLLPLILDGPSEHRVAFMEFNLFHGQQVALFDGRYKFVWDVRKEKGFYYDLLRDPGETQRIGRDQPLFNTLFEQLKAKRHQLKKAAKNKPSNPTEMDDATIKALQSLGYIEKASE